MIAYPLHDPGPWWNVFQHNPDRPGTFFSIDHIPFRRTEVESQQDLAEWAEEVPHARLEVVEFDELWHARCVACGFPRDDEDYLHTSWTEVANLAVNEAKGWVFDLDHRLIWCGGCHQDASSGAA